MSNTFQTKTTNVPPKSKSKSRINRRQRNRRRNRQKLVNTNQQRGQTQTTGTRVTFSEKAQREGAKFWGEAYANAVRWHGEHQNNFWRHAAEQLQSENQMLRQQLEYVANIKPETQTELCYETSDEDCEKDTIAVKKEPEDEDEVDSKYLEFLQVTIKHREELRLKREAADLLEEEGSISGDVG